MANTIDSSKIEAVGKVLTNEERPLKERFRALFTLRNIGGKQSIEWIAKCFNDPSELLKHECGYCLGQMGDNDAIPYLTAVLQDINQEPIVRHEAGEALGAIGSVTVLDLLKKHCNDPVIEVSETCELAVRRMEWQINQRNEKGQLPENPFYSVDPAPPEVKSVQDVDALKSRLLDEDLPLFERYRAMFSLRNKNNAEGALALAEGLKCKSALFRHEIAYVLGQMQHEAGTNQLIINLKDLNEHPMVRHECAEALGSIATDECMKVLEEYLHDGSRVVKESCEVALDMCDYAQTKEFQYADTLSKVNEDS